MNFRNNTGLTRDAEKPFSDGDGQVDMSVPCVDTIRDAR